MSTEPPGPKGLPLVGNTHQYARDPFMFMSAVGRAYGDVAKFELGGRPTYMLTNPEDIQTVLVSREADFHKPQFGDDAVEQLLGNGLLLSEGEFWRDQRTLIQGAFDPRRIVDLGDTMVEHAERLCERWSPGDVVDIREEMAQVTVAIIVEAMFGTTIEQATVERVQEALEPLGQRFEPDAVRFLTPDWVPTDENRQFGDAVRTLEGVLDDIVAERRAEGYEDGEDMLSVLLRAQDAGKQSDDVMRDELMTMLLAGHDTTALTLTYTYYLLDRNPEVKARFYEEVNGIEGRPTAADARSMAYTNDVLNESMRIYPPVYTMFREPDVDVTLGGYRVPKGSLVMLPQWVVHRHPRYWEQPETFDPDRWDRDTDRPNYAYFPFGGGPRICIGKQFSLLEAKLILATVAREFDLGLVSDTELDLRPSLTMHPATPVEMELHPR